MLTALMALGCVLVLAFFNGANDVSKGIATLVGSGVTRLKTAVLWGTSWTLAGALTAALAAQGLVAAFSGSGIISPLPVGLAFLTAVCGGALAWVWFATRSGLPVSTTHAITGALVGAGLVAVSFHGIRWTVLAEKFFLPLAVSPVLALVLMYALFPALNGALGWLHDYCVCSPQGILAQGNQRTAVIAVPDPNLVVGPAAECDGSTSGGFRLNFMDALHWISAGATSFARGLNDAPKILALGLAANLALGLSSSVGFLLVGVAMGLGSLLAGFRVTETLAHKVTRMSPNEGFAANLITSLLVIFASRLALPVSTTHVSSGAIIGLGLRRGGNSIQWKTVRDMLLAWVITLPTAAACAALIYWLTGWFH
jgi:PiT family inorganic phosphate transporter